MVSTFEILAGNKYIKVCLFAQTTGYFSIQISVIRSWTMLDHMFDDITSLSCAAPHMEIGNWVTVYFLLEKIVMPTSFWFYA